MPRLNFISTFYLAVEKLFCLILRFAGELNAELFEYLFIHAGEKDCGMGLRTAKLGKLLECQRRIFVCDRCNGECEQNLVHMEVGILVAHVGGLELLDGFDNGGRKESCGIVDSGEVLERVEEHGRAGTEKLGGFARNDRAVLQFECNGGSIGFFGLLKSGNDCGTHFLLNAELVHDQLDLLYFAFFTRTLTNGAERGVISTDDFLTGSFVSSFVVENAIADHIDTHIRGALVGRLSVNFFKHDLENGEDCDISVVIDSGNTVCFQMIRVDHVDVAHVRGCRLVSEVHGMAQGEIPDGEGFEFRIAGTNSSSMLMIKLGEASCHFSASGTGSGDDDKLSSGFDIFIFAESVFTDNVGDVGRIIFYRIVAVYFDAHALQTFLEELGGMLLAIVRNDNASDVKTDATEFVDQTKRIQIVCDAEVAALLILFNIVCRNGDNDFRAVAKLVEHFNLAVGKKTGKYTGGMIVVEKLAAEFEIEFPSEG